MISNWIKITLCLLLTYIALIECNEGLTAESSNNNVNNVVSGGPLVPKSQLTGPEPRQITLSMDSSRNSGGYPYNLQLYGNNLPQTPSSSGGGSFLSMFRPQGGRRSSLTSRLRNLMSALFFRRETSTPYLGSGSSYSFAYRQPPLGYGTGMSPGSNYLGSDSNRYPVVFGNYPSSSVSSPTWSNYKQWASGGVNSGSLPASLASQLNSASSPSNNYAWSSSLANSGNSYSNLGSSLGYGSGLSSALSSTGSGSSAASPASPLSSSSSLNGNYASSSAYQAAASNAYPSAVYPPSYLNQRTALNYKPANNAYTSSLTSLSSSSSPSSSSSSLSSSSGSSSSSLNNYSNSGSNKPSSSYSQ